MYKTPENSPKKNPNTPPNPPKKTDIEYDNSTAMELRRLQVPQIPQNRNNVVGRDNNRNDISKPKYIPRNKR